MTTYGYARVSRGRNDGTDTLQNQRLRLSGAGVDADHIYQDIITGTVMQRPGLNGGWRLSGPETSYWWPRCTGWDEIRRVYWI